MAIRVVAAQLGEDGRDLGGKVDLKRSSGLDDHDGFRLEPSQRSSQLGDALLASFKQAWRNGPQDLRRIKTDHDLLRNVALTPIGERGCRQETMCVTSADNGTNRGLE